MHSAIIDPSMTNNFVLFVNISALKILGEECNVALDLSNRDLHFGLVHNACPPAETCGNGNS